MNQHPNHSHSDLPGSQAHQDSIPLAWYSDYPNWGDAINPVLAGLLSGKPVRKVEVGEGDCYIAVGSILWMADSRTEVWGSGFMKAENTVQAPPKKIHAVRGPLTREVLRTQGIECPEVYGDPVLLLPQFYNPKVDPQYEVGLVPHISDKEQPWIEQQRGQPGVLVIDVQGDAWEFVQAVKSCRVILSSSLHGLICADAYGVPNAWIRPSERVPGGDFKFRDYRLSIGAEEPKPLHVTADTLMLDLASQAKPHPLHIDLRKLLLACPFLNAELRATFAGSSFGGSNPPPPKIR
jgi:pyruvyltransferase